MTRDEADRIVREAAAHWASALRDGDGPSPDMERELEIREALAKLDEKPPEGVPEVVYIGDDGETYSPEFGDKIYRYAGTVEVNPDGSVKP